MNNNVETGQEQPMVERLIQGLTYENDRMQGYLDSIRSKMDASVPLTPTPIAAPSQIDGVPRLVPPQIDRIGEQMDKLQRLNSQLYDLMHHLGRII